MKVLLITGAWSPEREVALNGAKVIQQALEERGHSVTFCDPLYEFDNIVALAKAHDVSFINLHGSPGEDGLIQAILTQAYCKFQGSDAQSSFLALHKAAAKQIYRCAGLLTADWHFLPQKPDNTWTADFDYPLFIKSNNGGSSIDIAKIESFEELHTQLEKLFEKNCEVIVEPMITGEEITCAVIERKGILEALPPILIKPKKDTFFDYANKYAIDEENAAEEICPAPLSQKILDKVQEITCKAHTALGLKGYSRSDFILTKDNELYLLETNTIPGMTQTSLVPRAAKVAGISFGELLEILLENALQEK